MKPLPSPYRAWWSPADHQEFTDNVLKGRYQSIYLTTPPSVTENYLRKLSATSQSLLVIAEKPWFCDYQSAQSLAGELDDSDVTFRFFDHYLYRGAVRHLSQLPLEEWLGGPIRAVDIRLFESAPWTSDAQGQSGIVRDLLIHAVSLCHKLLPGAALVVTGATAARHMDSTFDTETYASMEVQAGNEESIPINLAAAKFMPASSAGKQMIVTGDDAQLEIDLAADTADLVDSRGTRRLYPHGNERLPDAYELLVDKLAAADDDVGFELHEALYVLRLLDDVKLILREKPLVVLDATKYSKLAELPNMPSSRPIGQV